MNFLRKAAEVLAAARNIGLLRQARYIALVIAIAGLIWSGIALGEMQRRDETARRTASDTSHAVSDLRLQIARQRTVVQALPAGTAIDDCTPEGLISRVGAEARRAGMHLAQSRVIATPPSALPPAPAPQGGQPSGPQRPAPAPPPDPGGVEFHLTGSYGSLQMLLKSVVGSNARFQVLTLDVLRAKVTESSGAAQLDVRLVCVL